MFFVDETFFVIATIEFLGTIICFLSIVGECIRKSEQYRLSRTMKIVLFLTAICLFTDGISFLISGNPQTHLVPFHRISLYIDCISFIFALYFLACHFLKNEFIKKTQLYSVLINIIRIITGLNCALVTVSQFTSVLYSVDPHNNYTTGPGLYFYAISLLIEAASVILIAIYERKTLKKSIFLEINICAWGLIIGGVLELILGRFPGSNFGLGIGIICIFIIEQIKLNNKVENKPQSFSLSFINFFLFTAIFICVAFLINIVSLMRVAKDNSENNSQVIAQMIGESINNAIMEPITSARTISQSSTVVESLKAEQLSSEIHVNPTLVEYLDSVKNGMGYQLAFAISDQSYQYYNNRGVPRIIDPVNNSHDVWYASFLDSNREYDLDVDYDEDNFNKLSVFVNTRVEDTDGSLLGVCGVGMTMDKLQAVLIEYEERYNIDISLVDSTGLIQVDSNGDNIEVEYLANTSLAKAKSDGFYYEVLNDHIQMTKYMENIDWFIIITDYHPDKIGILHITMPGILAAVIGLLLIVISFLGIHLYQDRIGELIYLKNEHEKYLIRLSKVDELTGIKNRNSFEEYKKELDQTGIVNEKMQIILMDINGLKTVNDKFGHAAGDELIIGAAQCIKDTLGTISDIYRIGGDEFIAISYADNDEIQDQMDRLYSTLLNWSGYMVKELSISIGMVSAIDEPNKSFNELFKIADKRMYADKNEYYRRTGKDRRMSW